MYAAPARREVCMQGWWLMLLARVCLSGIVVEEGGVHWP